jgi:tetratricopeptide (TPR) repeat protein
VALSLGQFNSVSFLPQARSTIDGRVTSPDGRGLAMIQVSLQNDGYAFSGMVYTDGSGHFRFPNLRSGTYYVTVEPGSTFYERQTLRIEVVPFNERRGGGGELFRADVIMRLRKDYNGAPHSSAVVFYQFVPDAAKKEFNRGMKRLGKSEFDEGFTSLKRAIEIFPDYYDALELLGTEYVKRQMYEPAVPLLTRAVELNKSGWRGFYSLGIAQYNLNQHNQAAQLLRRAVELDPDDSNAKMWLGIALSQDVATRAEAIQTLEKLVRKAKNKVPMAYLYLGGLYAKNDQYREAARAFENLLRAAPQINERDKIRQLIEEYKQKAKLQTN